MAQRAQLEWRRRRIRQLSSLLLLVVAFAEARTTSRKNHQQLQNQPQQVNQASRNLRARVVGGQPATIGEYSFFAQWTGPHCGGAVIHEDVVISAAHCYDPLNPPALRTLYLNSHVRDAGIQRRYAEVIPHPMYNPVLDQEYGFTQEAYDFVLLKTVDSMFVDENGQPTGVTAVNINRDPNKPQDNDRVVAAGFGQTNEDNSGSMSDTLLDVTLFKVSDTFCRNQYNEPGRLDPNVMFCTGVPGGGKDTCQGDSGGPVTDYNDGTLLGLVSFGVGCGRVAFPGVNSRVSAVVDWIDEMICEISSFPPASCPPRQTPPPSTSRPTLPPSPTTSRPTLPPSPTFPPTLPPSSKQPTLPPATSSQLNHDEMSVDRTVTDNTQPPVETTPQSPAEEDEEPSSFEANVSENNSDSAQSSSPGGSGGSAVGSPTSSGSPVPLRPGSGGSSNTPGGSGNNDLSVAAVFPGDGPLVATNAFTFNIKYRSNTQRVRWSLWYEKGYLTDNWVPYFQSSRGVDYALQSETFLNLNGDQWWKIHVDDPQAETRVDKSNDPIRWMSIMAPRGYLVWGKDKDFHQGSYDIYVQLNQNGIVANVTEGIRL